MSDKKGNLTWEDYFEREGKSLFQKLLSLHKKVFMSQSVRYYTDKCFSGKGIFLEAGAGTSQSSSRIAKLDRRLIALDYNYYVMQHNILRHKIQGNILSLPIKSGSVDGLWNVGVMEHLTDEEIIISLKEFKRIMKDGGVLLMFWPSCFAPYEIVLNTVSWFSRRLLRKEIEFCPKEINLYQNKSKLLRFLNESGLKLIRLDYNILDLFSCIVVIAKK